MKTYEMTIWNSALIVCMWGNMVVAMNVETVPVNDIGNQGELSGEGAGGDGPNRICGAVDYRYAIGKYEVTAGQYTEFLNKVARTDTYGLYNTDMDTANNQYGCNIKRSGSPGSYSYSVASDWANRPVNLVSFWDACRFANWLHNGQPNGSQESGTTETGTYTLNGYDGYDGRIIQRSADWKWAVASEDEWYKAAYYKGGSTNAGYWKYPTSSDLAPGQDMADVSGNNANYYTSPNAYPIDSPYYTTMAGEFQNSDSSYGTFDQGGNVWEWNDSIIDQIDMYTYRGLRGGSFALTGGLQASIRYDGPPPFEAYDVGFRVVEIPEPTTIAIMALGVMGMLGRQRELGRA